MATSTATRWSGRSRRRQAADLWADLQPGDDRGDRRREGPVGDRPRRVHAETTMSTTALMLTTLSKAEEARINDHNNDLMQEHISAILDDPNALPPDPVTVFLPANDPAGLDEALALALTYAR